MEFRILGPLEVSDGDRLVEIAGAKRRTVLALLLLRANEVVRTDRLVEDLWGGHPPGNAAAALQNQISRLRKSLGPEVIVGQAWGYALRTPPDTIDLRRFERLVLEADPLPAGERARQIADALTLWRGPALSDLAGEPALERDIARLDELYLDTLERRIDADLETGRGSELIGELQALIADHPLREHLRSQLILALYRAGRQAEALEVYRETHRVLADELGLEPSPELRELERAILRQDPALGPSPALPPAPREPGTHPPASKRRRWLAGGIAGVLLVVAGLAAAALIAVHPGHARRADLELPLGASSPKGWQTISDSFGASAVDPTVWYQSENGDNWTMAEHKGHLEFAFAPDATPGGVWHNFGGQVGTLCAFPGNFDARVHFRLVRWPAGNGLSAGLTAFLGPENTSFAALRSSDPNGGEQYDSQTGFWSNYPVDTGDAGALRVTRRHGVITTYYFDRGRWVKMRSAPNAESAKLAVGVQAQTNELRGMAAVIDFTNFSVASNDFDCPPNARPPTA